MRRDRGSIPSRGAADNPRNRYETLRYIAEAEALAEDVAHATQFFRDNARSILTTNASPDVGFTVSINPYRGCEHGCIYCYARPSHEQLGFSAGLDFETKVLVKENAAELLRRELSSSRWEPQVVAISGVTDPYQPVERRLELTRRCLEVFQEHRNPVAIITKNHLVSRDLDILAELARRQAAVVYLSITTLDGGLSRILEPRASQPNGRLAALEQLAKAGVPAGVMVAPVIPGLTDHEIPSIVEAAARAGARFAGSVPLRLPHGVKDLFEGWLDEHLPARKAKILERVRGLRGGKLNDSRFGSRMQGEGVFAELVRDLFRLACRKAGLSQHGPQLSTAEFRRPFGTQAMLFE